MKILRTLCFAALTAAAAFAADVVPVFNATLTVGKESRFVLLGSDAKASSWLKVGDSFEGYTIKSYDAKTSTLDLEKDGKVTHVTLAADATVANGGVSFANTHATIQDATALLDTMHFETMLDRTMAGVKKQQMAMMERMVGQGAKSPEEKEAMIAFQKKVVEEMMSTITGADMKNDVAKVYSEVFSKDELQGLSNFYSSPVGQSFSDKQPELAEKMNALMMPKIMAMMPKIQKMGQEFKAQLDAKRAAAQSAAPAAPAAPAPSAP